MNKKIRAYFILLCIFLFLKIPICQSQGIWTYYTDELPGIVFDMTQDKYGNYWFATTNGVCQFDTNGHWFTLVDSTVWDSTMYFKKEIEVDRENNKWFIGLTMSNPTKEYVVKYDDSTFVYYNPSGEESDTWINALGIDSSGYIWAGSMANWAYWFDGDVWHRFFVPGTYIYDSINDIKVDRKGNLYFAHDNGISSLEYGYMWGDGMRTVIELTFGQQNRLWFATLMDGLGTYDGSNWRLYTITDGLKRNRISSVAIDSNQNIWISYAGDYGVSKFDGNKWTHLSVENGLIDNDVGKIFVDKKGAIWFATPKGVSVFQDTTTTSAKPSSSKNKINRISLFQNYPNPFNPETEITYQIPQRSHIELTIFNLQGQKIKTLFVGEQLAGNHRVKWNGRDERGNEMVSGIYIYQLRAGKFMQSRKMILVR